MIRPREQFAISTLVGIWLWASLVPNSVHAADNPWGEVSAPSNARSEAIGSYDLGCLAGGVALPANGPGFVTMRLSRKRNFGHPVVISFIKALGLAAARMPGNTLLIGDLSQPRGGPPVSGHRSHQTGLDVDIWYQSLEDYRADGWQATDLASRDPASMVDAQNLVLLMNRWRWRHTELLKAVAEYPAVDRVFVNPGIKRALCRIARGDRTWLMKLRPWWGHDEHMHVRLRCPAGESSCVGQPPLPHGDGCDGSLDWWFSAEARYPRPHTTVVERRPPVKCEVVLRNEE